MQITIDTPKYLQIAELKVSLELNQEMVLALFIGYLVSTQKVPDEIQKALDTMKEEDVPVDGRCSLKHGRTAAAMQFRTSMKFWGNGSRMR